MQFHIFKVQANGKKVKLAAFYADRYEFENDTNHINFFEVEKGFWGNVKSETQVASFLYTYDQNIYVVKAGSEVSDVTLA